jgi:nucleoside-diphosphate-sugar epimerase
VTGAGGLAPGSVVAVTGASGFIGRYLADELRAAGLTPRTLGRGAGTDRQTDYRRDSLTAALQGASAVVHLAGRRMTREDAPLDLAPFWEPNVALIADLVGAARDAGVGAIVLASTVAVYSGAESLPWREDGPTRPVNAYALSKLMAEQHLELLTRSHGPRAVSLRLAAVYGHGEKGTPALMKFAGQAAAGQTLVLTGNPNYTIDQIYVQDVTAAILAALTRPVRGVFNIGGGRGWRVAEIVETANAVWDNAGNLRDESSAADPLPELAMDITRAARELGWRPGFDLRAGLGAMRRRQQQDPTA